MAALTPAQQEAIKEPGFSFCNRHFAVINHGPRKWVLKGLEGGAWPNYWAMVASEALASFRMNRELEKHIEYLNDMVNRFQAERDDYRTRYFKLQERLAQVATARDA